MSVLVLLRHGQSVWNQENRFTGWVDVPLAEKGEMEARAAGLFLKESGLMVDCVFVSSLMRAQQTACLALLAQGRTPVFQHPEGEMAKKGAFKNPDDVPWVPLYADNRLNERHYGDLQGLNKANACKEHGEDQVKIWRRSYEVAPPGGESLKDTQVRVEACFNEHVLPATSAHQCVLVAAHGNSLRALIMHLEGLGGDEIAGCEIATGVPRIYQKTTSGFVLRES